MCEFSGKLIAWLDGELASDEAAGVERHVPACAGCRSAIESYKRVSCEFSAYCEHALEASSTDSRMPRWIPAASAAGVVAAFLVLFLAWPRAATERPGPRVPQQVAVATSATFDTPGTVPASIAPIRVTHHQHSAATPVQIAKPSANPGAQPAHSQNTYFATEDPVIQIAIPADEMFPPGTVPEGIRFAADLTIAPDGTAESLRLRPRLAGFERRTTQP